MGSIKDVFIINEGMNEKLRAKILPIAREMKLELNHIRKSEPQMDEMTIRMIGAVDDIILECGLQGNRFKMKTRFEELLKDASIIRKAAGFSLLTKPGGAKPLADMDIGGKKVKTPDEKSVVYFLSLVKELSDVVLEAFKPKPTR